MKVKNLIKDLIQASYLLMFLLTSLSVAGHIEKDMTMPKSLIITFIISAFLSYGKIIYMHITKD